MSMSEGIQRLLAILVDLGFACTNINCRNKEAQRKLSKQINEWLSVIIWTTITASGPLPKGTKAVKTILVGKRLDEALWMMKKTPRHKKSREAFAEIFRRRVETLIRLGESMERCEHHNEPMKLIVSGRDIICWQCMHSDCNTRIPIDWALSDQVKSETPDHFWNKKRA